MQENLSLFLAKRKQREWCYESRPLRTASTLHTADPGRELHPLKSSGFHGALFRQLLTMAGNRADWLTLQWAIGVSPFTFCNGKPNSFINAGSSHYDMT